MTSQFNDHITTDLKQEMPYLIKTGNRIPHGEEMYPALRMGIHGEKITSLCKNN